MNAKYEDENIQSRLRHLLKLRKATPWGAGIGLTEGTVTRLTKGKPPGPESLGAICWAENCSLSWLLEGKGPPYVVAVRETDAGAAEQLQAWLQDEAGWAVHAVHGAHTGTWWAVVLHQPAALEVAGREVRYTAMEVLAGRLGPVTAAVLADARQAGRRVERTALAEDRAIAVAEGQAGTWLLLGEGGWLAEAAPVPLGVAETDARYGADPLSTNIGRLEPPHRHAVRVLVEALLEGEGKG